MFGTYNYSIIVGVIYVAGVLFAFLVLTIMNYFLLPLWSTGYLNLEYMISDFGDPVALHCITWHLELCRESMVVSVSVQHRLLGITMQLHTLLSMKAGVHMHPYAYSIIGFGIMLQLHTLMGMKAGVHHGHCYAFFLWLKVGCGGDMSLHTYTVLLW